MGFASDPSDIASVVLAARFEKQINLFFDASDAKSDERIHLFNMKNGVIDFGSPKTTSVVEQIS